MTHDIGLRSFGLYPAHEIAGTLIAACAAMAREGKQVCIVDADIGLRDQDVLLGLENRIVFDLLDVASGSCTLEQALISPEGMSRLSLLPLKPMW